MHFPLNSLMGPTPAMTPLAAPAETIGSGGRTPVGHVAEIVIFRLADGTGEAAFLEAVRATGPLIAATPGFLVRHLSRSGDGLWTEHILWKSLAEAEAAAQVVMADPRALPFLQAIDSQCMWMRHATLDWQMP